MSERVGVTRSLLAGYLGVVLALSIAVAARGDIVADLYAAEVPVTDQTAGARASAAGDALAEVLVKATGSEGVLDNPVIRDALGKAPQQVQQYAYRRGEAPGELYARIEFDADYVTDLVARAGEPLWTANRPRVLVWLLLEDAEGRRFVSAETTPALAAELVAEFDRRGVPLQLPLYDLADSAALSTEQAWRLSGPALQAASERYRVEDILAGRVAALSSGSWVGDWSYLRAEDRSDRAVTAATSRDFSREGAAMVAESMAQRYAVAPTVDPEEGVTLSVTGVDRYADYAQIVSWLEQLELVEYANVEWVRGDEIRLRLKAQAEASQLAAIIELNRRLQPRPAGASDAALSYQWQN